MCLIQLGIVGGTIWFLHIAAIESGKTPNPGIALMIGVVLAVIFTAVVIHTGTLLAFLGLSVKRAFRNDRQNKSVTGEAFTPSGGRRELPKPDGRLR